MWDLGRRWEKFGGDEWTPNRLVGDSIHTGAATWFRSPATVDRESIAENAAVNFLTKGWPADAPIEFAIEAQTKTIQRCLKALWKKIADWGEYKVVGVEKSFGESIVDLIILHDEHGPEPWLRAVDWKFHDFLKPEHVHYRVEDTEITHQFWHYAWRVQNHYGRPVRLFTKVMVIGAPSVRVTPVDMEVSQPLLDKWEEGAWAQWSVMDAMRSGTLPLFPRYEGCKMYGGCAFYDGCHRHAADESTFPALGYKPKVWEDRKAR